MGKINSKVNENYVKTKIDSMCGCPKKKKRWNSTQDKTMKQLATCLKNSVRKQLLSVIIAKNQCTNTFSSITTKMDALKYNYN